MSPHMALGSDPSSIKGARLGRDVLKRVWGVARPYRTMLVGFVITIVGAALVNLAPPLLLRSIIDDAIPEGDGSMLDSTLFLYGTGISDSNTHFHDDLPIALVGGKNAGIRGGRYLRYPADTPLANLHVTILEKLGVPVEALGDSTGPLGRLTGV